MPQPKLHVVRRATEELSDVSPGLKHPQWFYSGSQ